MRCVACDACFADPAEPTIGTGVCEKAAAGESAAGESSEVCLESPEKVPTEEAADDAVEEAARSNKALKLAFLGIYDSSSE